MKDVKKSNTIKLIWEDDVALSIAAAHYFVAACNRSIAVTGRFTVALSGGSTPKLLYQLLATPSFSRNIDWKKVLLFWGDERFVPHTNDDSNYKMVKESLFDNISIPKKNIFAVPTTKGTPAACATAYEKSIKDVLGAGQSFDLVLLGMGDDGHTASLFPGTEILKENKRLVKEVWVEAKHTFRVSFTYPLINRAKQIMFLVAGTAKAPVIKQVFSNKQLKNPYPVQGVAPKSGSVVWMLDDAAVTVK